ncbi:MAG: 5-(carboxyamino)imidazole ribonucleotide mutase [candidate division WOR-3 bacterium]
MVSILLGSDTDLPIMQETAKMLENFGIDFEIKILSAHRTPEAVRSYVKQAEKKGIKIFIAGAGGAAHLPGLVAAYTTLPVIGVPLGSELNGLDSLFSIVQMPKGVPVGTVAIGKAGAINSAILAAEILALSDKDLKRKLQDYRKNLEREVLNKSKSLGGSDA